jgi:hypothetical protein
MEIQEEDIRRIKEALGGVSDPRRQWGFIRHKLLDMHAGHRVMLNHCKRGIL